MKLQNILNIHCRILPDKIRRTKFYPPIKGEVQYFVGSWHAP